MRTGSLERAEVFRLENLVSWKREFGLIHAVANQEEFIPSCPRSSSVGPVLQPVKVL